MKKTRGRTPTPRDREGDRERLIKREETIQKREQKSKKQKKGREGGREGKEERKDEERIDISSYTRGYRKESE